MPWQLVLESVNPKYRAAAIQAAFGLGYPRSATMGGGISYWTDRLLPPNLRTIAEALDSAPRVLAFGLDQADAERFKRELERGPEKSEYPLPGPDEVACVVTIRED